MSKKNLTRRDFLKGAAAGVAGASFVGHIPSININTKYGYRKARQGDPIKAGAMYLLTGTFAAYGEFAREGIEMAMEELNEMGGVLGREVTALFEHEGGADGVVQVAQRFALEENCDFLIGIDSSGTAEALVPVVPTLEKPLMITHAATPRATGEFCNSFVFRCSVNVPQNQKAGATLAAEEGYTRWSTIGPDYAFGHQVWEYFEKYLSEMNPDAEFMDETFFPALGAEDFTSFITAAMDAGPDAIYSSLWGGDLVNFVRQANPLGLFDEIPVFFNLGAAMEVLNALGDDMPEGLWVGTRYWWGYPDSEVNNAFVEKFAEKYEKMPSYNAQNGYAGMKIMAAAMEAAGSTEPQDVVAALEGIEIEVPMGEITIRAEDHQAVVGVPWGKTVASDMYDFRVLDPVRYFDAETVTRPVEETMCMMG